MGLPLDALRHDQEDVSHCRQCQRRHKYLTREAASGLADVEPWLKQHKADKSSGECDNNERERRHVCIIACRALGSTAR